MEQPNIRQELHRFVDTGDNKLLNLMYAVAKQYNEDYNADHPFTKEDIAILNERRNKRLSGESKGYNWEDAKAIIRGAKL